MIDEQIGAALAAIIALGLALKAGVGPVVMYLTEAIKDAIQPPPGWGGLISVITGVGLGAAIGALAALITEDSSLGTFIAFGAVGGLFMASGAIESHKAAASVNTSASAAIVDGEIKAENRAASLAQRFGFSFPNHGDSEAEYVSGQTYGAPHWSGAELEDGEDDNFNWAAAREAGGHTGQAIDAEPIKTEPPSEEWRGSGAPGGAQTNGSAQALAGAPVTSTSA